MQAWRDRWRSAIFEIIMIGSLRVGWQRASSKIGFDHVGEDGTRRGEVEVCNGRIHLIETLAAAGGGKQRDREKCGIAKHGPNAEVLRRVFFKLKKRAAPGVDGVTWEDYAADL